MYFTVPPSLFPYENLIIIVIALKLSVFFFSGQLSLPYNCNLELLTCSHTTLPFEYHKIEFYLNTYTTHTHTHTHLHVFFHFLVSIERICYATTLGMVSLSSDVRYILSLVELHVEQKYSGRPEGNASL